MTVLEQNFYKTVINTLPQILEVMQVPYTNQVEHKLKKVLDDLEELLEELEDMIGDVSVRDFEIINHSIAQIKDILEIED